MADKPPIKPPGSITQPADNQNERIAEISNVNRAISNMQQKVNQQLAEAQVDVGEFEGIEEVQGSMVKVLNTLNDTMGTLGHGFAKIAADTGKASTDAIRQYGKAISEDIGLNKRNIVATALAQSSPIFGYFAAKFVETDVFQSAKEKMKSNISDALGGITSKFKEGFGGLIGKAKEKAKREKPIKRAVPEPGEIPKMQTGGYVQKAGMAYLHPAEVVVPVEKILGKIDESIEITQELARISKRTQLHSLAKMGTYVKSLDHFEKVGVFKGFLRAMKQVQTQYQEPSDTRMLRALLAIQDALGAQITTSQQVWQKMLIEHPFFRNMAFAMKGLGSIFGLPFKFVYGIFKSRGGYASHLSKSKNPFEAINENIGKIYAEGMWRLDNIALYTKATAEATRDLSSALTGKKYAQLQGVPTGIWSFANLAKRFGALFTGRRRLGQKKSLEELYGTSSAMDMSRVLLPKEIADEASRITALPVSEIHIEQLSKRMETYMIENKKGQKKLLGYTSNMSDTIEGEYEVVKDMNRRERRRSIFGFFGGITGGIKSLMGKLFGFIPLAMGLVKYFISKVWTSFFPKGIGNSIALLMRSAGVIAGFKGLFALGIGAAIGTVIDKFIGVSEGFQAHLDRLDKLARDVGATNLAKIHERRELVAKGGAEGFRASKEMLVISELGRSAKERKKQYGLWGRMDINAIETAQRKYMNEHIGDYMLYGPRQVSALRTQWIKEGGYPAKHAGYPPLQYGAEREASFLKYLQAKGKPAALETLPGYEKYMKEHEPTVLEKVGGVVRDQKDMVSEYWAEKLAQTKSMEKAIEKQTKRIVAGSKELGQEVSGSINQVTSQVTSYVQNHSSVVNNAAQRVRDKFSEYEHAIIKGDYMMEGF